MPRTTGVRLIRWAVVPAMLLAGGLLIASNVVLQTGLVRGWVEGKLEKRSGLDWTIESLSWTPWSGIRVGGVRADLRDDRAGGVEPLYSVKSVDVSIYWRPLLRGRLAPREVRLNKVRGSVPIELMGLLPGPGTDERVTQEVPESVAGTGETPAGRPEEARASEPGDAAEAAEPLAENPAEPEEPRREISPLPGPIHASRPSAGAPVTLLVEDCELKIYSLGGSGKGRLAVEGVRAEVPLGGEDKDGWLSIDAVTVGGEPVAGPFRTPLRWERPFLLVPVTTFEWSGLAIQAAASVQARGDPRCRAEVRVLPGALERTPLPFWPEVNVAAARAEMHSMFRGNLADVRSWRGDSVAEVADVSVSQDDGREALEFESGRVITVMRGRAVQVADARLLSERLSFLGNGVVLPDGRVIGIARIIADREYAESLTRLAVGSFLAQGWTQSWFEPLITPDRYYRDINLRGTMRDAAVDVGRKGELMPVDVAWNRMAAFLNSEAEETRSGVAPSPPRERIWTPHVQ